MKRFIALLAMAVITAAIMGAVLVGQSSGSTVKTIHWQPISFTTNTNFSGVVELNAVLTKSNLPGCEEDDTVVGLGTLMGNNGDLIVFTGSKKVFCSGGTFTFEYRAFVSDAYRTDWGSWMITDGTGDYAAINGGGQIEGVGVTNADGTLTVTDNWDGKIAFP